ncbi:TIGR04540 family protein [Priestia megaterium]|uniref:TIGR04540 family protein n=1 Tax=Priestia megaterium TaxID=1404 RepID=UPI00077D7928|nr:TIGR04540 family protein [Priestia megaterium]
MQLKLFYKTQRELAMALNIVIDAYWENEINEEILINKVNETYKNNRSKMIKGEDFTTVLKQQCGKRRLEVITNILKSNTKVK